MTELERQHRARAAPDLPAPRSDQLSGNTLGASSNRAVQLRRAQRTAGNRAVGRLLKGKNRPSAASRSLQRATFAEQTTAPNRALAQEIDELSLLSASELADLQDQARVQAAILDHPKHAAYERELEALEFLESQGRVKKRTYIPPPFLPRDVEDRRAVRRNLEANVRRLGSFDDAALELNNWTFSQLEQNDLFTRWDAHVRFFTDEMDRFGKAFTAQAREIAVKLLAHSQSEILGVIESYGLARYPAFECAKKIARGADAKEEVDQLVHHSDAAWDRGPQNAKPKLTARRHRVGLGRIVKRLKSQQEAVRLALARSWEFPMEDTHGMVIRKAKEELTAMWLEAERQHPAIAAFRGSETDLEDVDLGALDDDLHGSEPQMTELLGNILPKLADIIKARGQIDGGHLKPLTLPPVVALTKAVMFVPEGSLRAGKVNDLVEAASKTTTGQRIAMAVMTLIVVATLIPSGGTSLGIGIGLVSAALSAATAFEDWEDYQQHKLLANTSLDRAKALSLEEPSLFAFAFDLVTLGLDGAPLVKAFREAVAIKSLLRAGEGAESKAVKELVADLNEIGKAKGEADLGEKALKEAEAAEKDAVRAGREAPTHEREPKPKGPEAGEVKQTAAKPWKPPPGSPHADVGELRKAIQDPLTTLDHGWTNMNSEWLELLSVDRNALIAKYGQDRALWEKLDEAYTILRDPKKLEAGMVKIYLGAAEKGITPEEWLISYFGGKAGMPILQDATPEIFRTAMLADKPALDEILQDARHGLLTHAFQEFVLAEEWGGRAAARDFRHAIANVNGPAAGSKQMFSRVWDALFDSLDANAINRPEVLGPILHAHLKLPGRP
jgi:hypothetical protein